MHPTYTDTWDLPLGYLERGESPAAACRRELGDELGLDRKPLRLLSVDWAPSEKEGDTLLFLFDCGELGEDEGRMRLNRDEQDRWVWIDLDLLNRYVLERTARRIRSTLAASAVYLEHGSAATES